MCDIRLLRPWVCDIRTYLYHHPYLMTLFSFLDDGTAPTLSIKLLHHPKTFPTELTNNMALLCHTPSSCCIITKQFHQRLQTPWHCSNTPHQVVALAQNSSRTAHKTLWPCSNYRKISPNRSQTPGHFSPVVASPQSVPPPLTNTKAQLQLTPSSCSTSAHKHHGVIVVSAL